MSDKIKCPTCGTLLSETLTAKEIKEMNNPCDTVTQAYFAHTENEKTFTGTYTPTLIPGCPAEEKKKPDPMAMLLCMRKKLERAMKDLTPMATIALHGEIQQIIDALKKEPQQ
jgi:hypothetical protein